MRFFRQKEQLGLGHAVLCVERVVDNELFTLLLVDDFLTYSGNGITPDLISGYEKTGTSQLSVMKVEGPDISKFVDNVNNCTNHFFIKLLSLK